MQERSQVPGEAYKLDKEAEKLNNVFEILSKYNLTDEQRMFIINYRYMLSYNQMEIIIQRFLEGYSIEDVQEKVITKMKNENQKNIEEPEESVER